jgi:uncharacterized membrane protein
MSYLEVIEAVGRTIDAVGVGVIAVGVLASTAVAVIGLTRRDPGVYRRLREQMGRSILLGLEFLIAGDIIRTVAVTPDLRSLGVLAGIVAIRTLLSFTLQLEVTGRWPWQNGSSERRAAAAP